MVLYPSHLRRPEFQQIRHRIEEEKEEGGGEEEGDDTVTQKQFLLNENFIKFEIAPI